jgi:[ribosomal protein S5]-alanine N-acetyltransferase
MAEAWQTDRLLIREWQENDAGDLFDHFDDIWTLEIGQRLFNTIDEALASIHIWNENQEMRAIVLKQNNELIGLLGLADVNRHDRYKEIEYAIAEDYRNQGYATEAVKRTLEYAFVDKDLMIVAACLKSSNIESRHVLEKCGFTYEGTLRNYGRDASDMLRYSITKQEWAKQEK